MKSFKEFYSSDLKRYGPDSAADGFTRRWLKYFRKIQTAPNKFVYYYYTVKYKLLCKLRNIEIPTNTVIGEGLYLGHFYNIVVNSDVVIGRNCNLHKGVVIGQTNRGAKKGVPVIGDCVWIGVNAVIVGGITIGDDVLIAPNAYVNCDVPSHSVVLGNPCIIKPKENATESYVTFKC